MSIKLYTLGSNEKTAEVFFIDIRLKNTSPMAGFTRIGHLGFFLRELCDCSYRHEPGLAPTKELFDDYRENRITWDRYVEVFNRIIIERRMETLVTPAELDHACLLCSEPTADQCHRRLVAEYLREKIGGIEIVHL
jgi:uncharacterized protein (DUF488 family)